MGCLKKIGLKPKLYLTPKGKYAGKSKKITNKGGVIHSLNDTIIIRPTSKVLYYLYKWYETNFMNLPKNLLSSYLAGLFDADGCISTKKGIKNGKKYITPHACFLISNDFEENQNYLLSLLRLGVYSKIKQKTNLIELSITGRNSVKRLMSLLKEDSQKVKINYRLVERKTKISSGIDKIPYFLTTKLLNQISSDVKKTILLKKGVWSLIYDYKKEKRLPSIEQLIKIKERLKNDISPILLKELDKIIGCNLLPQKIVEIKEINYTGKVYDLSVPKTRNFLANGIIVHNCIDEIDKLGEDDRNALHTPMESGIVPINKADIHTNLKSDCSILAVSNPKFGMFELGDSNNPLSKQINLPPPLLSRFDLIFVMIDKMDEKIDRKIVDTIYSKRETTDGLIPVPLFRKYITYAKKLKPKLLEANKHVLANFYSDVRKKSLSKDSKMRGMPITPRHLEGIMRLAEASAKIRLSETVDEEDLKLVQKLFYDSLLKLGMDEGLGVLDYALIGAGVPVSKRKKIDIIRRIISQIATRLGTNVPYEEIKKEADKLRIPKLDLDDSLLDLKKENEIFEPTRGYYQLVK